MPSSLYRTRWCLVPSSMPSPQTHKSTDWTLNQRRPHISQKHSASATWATASFAQLGTFPNHLVSWWLAGRKLMHPPFTGLSGFPRRYSGPSAGFKPVSQIRDVNDPSANWSTVWNASSLLYFSLPLSQTFETLLLFASPHNNAYNFPFKENTFPYYIL